jgi:hypothetical protein
VPSALSVHTPDLRLCLRLQEVHYRWIDQMAGYVKSLAPRQLVAAGTEGFFTEESGQNLVAFNPGGGVVAGAAHRATLSRLAIYAATGSARRAGGWQCWLTRRRR